MGLAGLVMIGVGAYQGYRGVTHDFLRDSKSEEMGPATRTSVKWIGTFGLLARMVVFGLVGVFLIKAAVEYDPSEAVGIDGALAKLANSSAGSAPARSRRRRVDRVRDLLLQRRPLPAHLSKPLHFGRPVVG